MIPLSCLYSKYEVAASQQIRNKDWKQGKHVNELISELRNLVHL